MSVYFINLHVHVLRQYSTLMQWVMCDILVLRSYIECFNHVVPFHRQLCEGVEGVCLYQGVSGTDDVVQCGWSPRPHLRAL